MPNRNVSVTPYITVEPETESEPESITLPTMQEVVSNRMVRQGFRQVHRKRRTRNALRYPPTLRAELKGRQVFRYTGTAAMEADITVANLLKTVGAASGSTAVRPIFTSIRLLRISIWTPVQAIGSAPTFCALRYEGTNTDDTTHYDTSAVADDMAHVSKPPPRNSVASFWHHSDLADTSLKLAWVSLGPDSVVDMHVEYVVDDNAVNSVYTYTGGSGMTAGCLYYGALGSGRVYTQPGKAQF